MKKINFVAILMTCVLLVSCGGLNSLGNGQTGSLTLELPDTAIEKVAKTVSDISGQSIVSFVRTNLNREAEEPEDEEETEIVINSEILKVGYTFTITDNTGKVYNESVWFTEEELAYFDALYFSKQEMDEAFWEAHPEYVQFKDKKYGVVFDDLLAIRIYSVNVALQIGGTSYFYGSKKDVKIEPSDENVLTVQLAENKSYYSPIPKLNGEYGDATRAGNYFTLTLDYKFNEPIVPADYSEDEEGAKAEAERLEKYSDASFQYAGLSSYPATISLKSDATSVKAEAFTIKDNTATKIDCSANDGVVSFEITKDDVLLEVIFTSTDVETGAYATTIVTVSNFVGKQMPGYIMYKGGDAEAGLWLESEIPEGEISCADPEWMKNSTNFKHFTLDLSNNLWYITADGEIYCNGKDVGWKAAGFESSPIRLTYDEAKNRLVVLADDSGKYCYIYCDTTGKVDDSFVLTSDKCEKTVLEGLSYQPTIFAANDGQIYLATAEEPYYTRGCIYQFYEGKQIERVSNIGYGGSTITVTDMAYKDGAIYTLNKYETKTGKLYWSRGALIKWNLNREGKLINKCTYYGTPSSSIPTGFRVKNVTYYIHSPRLNSTRELFGAEYFISNRDGCLVFSDDGFTIGVEKGELKLYNVNRVVTFDVYKHNFTMKDVKVPFMKEYSIEELD